MVSSSVHASPSSYTLTARRVFRSRRAMPVSAPRPICAIFSNASKAPILRAIMPAATSSMPRPFRPSRFSPRRSASGPPTSSRRDWGKRADSRSEEHTSELQSLMRISYAVFCLKKKKSTSPSHNQHRYVYDIHPQLQLKQHYIHHHTHLPSTATHTEKHPYQ